MSLLAKESLATDFIMIDVPDELSTPEEVLAMPAPEKLIIEGRCYTRHPNGGGLVENTAYVALTAFVGLNAIVRDFATVLGRAQLFDRAVAEGLAVIADRCSLGGRARVGGEAVLRGTVTLRGRAHVDGTATARGGILIDHVTHISEGNYVGSMVIG